VKPIFGSQTPSKPKQEATGDGSDQEEAEEGEHDPHFEPIVPLPDKIDIVTGEEDEEKLFCCRSQLYR